MHKEWPPLEKRISYRVSRLHARLNTQAARILSESAGLSLSQWRIMVMIDASGDTVTAREIVRLTKIDKALVSRAINSLASKGLVEVKVSETDGRLHTVGFTPAGRAKFDLAWPHMMARQNRLASALTEAQEAAFLEALGQIEATIAETEDLVGKAAQ